MITGNFFFILYGVIKGLFAAGSFVLILKGIRDNITSAYYIAFTSIIVVITVFLFSVNFDFHKQERKQMVNEYKMSNDNSMSIIPPKKTIKEFNYSKELNSIKIKEPK